MSTAHFKINIDIGIISYRPKLRNVLRRKFWQYCSDLILIAPQELCVLEMTVFLAAEICQYSRLA